MHYICLIKHSLSFLFSEWGKRIGQQGIMRGNWDGPIGNRAMGNGAIGHGGMGYGARFFFL